MDRHLEIPYERHDRVRRLIDAIRYCLESISLSFDGWNEPRIRGPGTYFAIVAGRSITDFADPMGDNRWPVDGSREVLADLDAFYEAAQPVALENDGAVVVSVDGVVQEQMVRFRDHPHEGDGYADWMGTRHMSALDTSLRDPVVATLTLSQETGRVTVFRDGEYDSIEHDDLASRWREG
ncbi:hypothetical protein CV102_06480 [Natronococcus pandeyae]|uniref:DAC domain-containing protein n=1 Tax=Natronococcus pandeyae TaxID=2055836 RepID=A0A8J8TTB1_9EURY|nr:diadenylate cyclase [Natronococcus pandeyae]TYL40000.1 hypothetical protein CV102_06480 [Natronococcus pandeyae]